MAHVQPKEDRVILFWWLKGPYVKEEVDSGFTGQDQDQWLEVIESGILVQ